MEFGGKHIVLIGMPGVGKSTVGKFLSQETGIRFIDTDKVIEENRGKKLKEIIEEVGEKGFLKVEERTIIHLLKKLKNIAIIATGGSVVYSKKAMKKLKEKGIVIFIDADIKLIKERIGNMKERGVIGEKKGIEELYKERKPLYEKWMDVKVVSNGNSEKVVEEIISLLYKGEKSSSYRKGPRSQEFQTHPLRQQD